MVNGNGNHLEVKLLVLQLECLLDQLHDEDKVRWTLTTNGVFLALLLGKP